MEVKPGYKQTEVGVIPEEWDLKTLGSLTSLLTNGFVGTATSAYIDGDDGVLYIQGYNVQENGFNFHGIKRVSKSFHARNQKSCLQPGDLLTIQTGDIGVTTVVPPELAGANCHALIISRLNKRVSEPSFYCQYFNSERGRAAFKEIETGTTMKHLNCGDMKRLFLPSPPVEEQRAIATALSDVDALLGALDRLIAKKRDLKQAAMQQLLTGQTRLKGFGPTKGFRRFDYGSIPEDWDLKPFKRVSSMNGRIGWQGLKQGEFTDTPDDPFLITGMNFKDGRIRWDEVYHIPAKRYQEAPAIQLQVGDVLITKDGTIGKLLFVDYIPHPGKASLNSHLLVFRPIDQQYDPKFLFYQLGSPTFAQHIELYKSGSTFFGLTQAATGKYPVVLPPLPEQTAIAAVLTDMDAELALLEARLAKTRALKQGMM